MSTDAPATHLGATTRTGVVSMSTESRTPLCNAPKTQCNAPTTLCNAPKTLCNAPINTLAQRSDSTTRTDAMGSRSDTTTPTDATVPHTDAATRTYSKVAAAPPRSDTTTHADEFVAAAPPRSDTTTHADVFVATAPSRSDATTRTVVNVRRSGTMTPTDAMVVAAPSRSDAAVSFATAPPRSDAMVVVAPSRSDAVVSVTTAPTHSDAMTRADVTVATAPSRSDATTRTVVKARRSGTMTPTDAMVVAAPSRSDAVVSVATAPPRSDATTRADAMVAAAPSRSDATTPTNASTHAQWCVPIFHPILMLLTDTTPQNVNVCELIDKSHVLKNYEYRFCPLAFPPTTNGRATLMTSLEKAAKDSCGLDIVVGTSEKKKLKTGMNLSFVLVCDCSLSYKSTAKTTKFDQENMQVISNSTYRAYSLHGDNTNKRPSSKGGKKGNHRTGTKKVLNAEVEGRCKFRLPVYANENGYFVRGGVGMSIHSNHHPPSCTTTSQKVASRHLSDEERLCLKAVNKANVGASVAANVLFAAHGTHVSRDQARGIVESTGDQGSLNGIVDVLSDHKANCVYLYQKVGVGREGEDNPMGTTTTNLLYNAVHDGTNVSVEPPNLEPSESSQISNISNQFRGVRGIQATQDVMVAYAWVLPFEKKQFELFPFVLHIDGTKCTNNENRVLFTVSGRDCMGKMFMVLRAFLPNECAWMFKWLFANAMPTLLGTDTLQHVQIIVTDGDSQETSQLDLAMKKYMPNAFRARCIWHIIDRGMRTAYPMHVSKNFRSKSEKRSFLALKETIRRWIWSWGKSDCETKEEFDLSVAIFSSFITSTKVRSVFDPRNEWPETTDRAIAAVIDFVRRNVEPLLPFFVFHERKRFLNFETNSNSAHEGMNHGMKSHAAPLKPQHTLKQATRTLCSQAKLKEIDTSRAVNAKYREKSLHSNLPTANKLTELGNGLLENQWKAKDEYDVSGPHQNEWFVRRKETGSPAKTTSPIPRFDRVRRVRFCTSNRFLSCSCSYFERIGIPCRHILKVLGTTHGPSYKGVDVQDIQVFWTKGFYYYGLGLNGAWTTEEGQAIAARCQQKLEGPALHVNLSTIPFVQNSSIVATMEKPLWQRCRNYDADTCRSFCDSNSSTYIPSNLSQESLGCVFANTLDDNDFDMDVECNTWDAWSEWSPLFKQWVDMAQANKTEEMKQWGNQRLLEVMADFQAQFFAESNSNEANGPSNAPVSLCIAQSNLRKTHGTKHFR